MLDTNAAEQREQLVDLIARWRRDPGAFCREALRFEPADYQLDVLEAVRDNPRVAFRSGHGVGKTEMASAAVLWFLVCFPDSKVITTASVWRQVNEFLWTAIHRHVSKAIALILSVSLVLTVAPGAAAQSYIIT